MTRSTTCRFCGLPGELIKGAHKECKNAETRERLRIRNNINPANYLYIGDRGKCKRCDSPAEPLSKLNLCREHMEENAREVIRKAKRKHMKKVRATPHKQPRVYEKPPQSQKMQRVTRAEKKAEPLKLLDTDEEKSRIAVLLKKAAEQRTLLNFSRWSE